MQLILLTTYKLKSGVIEYSDAGRRKICSDQQFVTSKFGTQIG